MRRPAGALRPRELGRLGAMTAVILVLNGAGLPRAVVARFG
jgi:hypothetical protein